MRAALLDGDAAPAPASTGSRRAEASRRSIQAPSVLQINQEAAVELLDKWRARGIHTPGKKQVVWEVMASRTLKSDDIAEAGYPGVEVMSRIERTDDPRARRPSQVGTPMSRLAKTSKWEGETIAPGGRIYARVYSWTSPANRLTEGIILLLIMANVISVVVDAVITPPDQPQTRFFRDLERFSTVIFTIEYLLRIGSCTAHPQFAGKAGSWCPWLTGRLSFMLKPLSALDLVALVPFYLDIWLESGFSMGGSREKHFRGGAALPPRPLLFRLAQASARRQPSSAAGSAVCAGLVLRGLRLLRVFSLLRLERQLAAVEILVKVFKSRSSELLVRSPIPPQPPPPLATCAILRKSQICQTC